jgi:Tfp pilus assembly protein PilZ
MVKPEQRRSHRLAIELPASFMVEEGQTFEALAVTLDISATGLRLHSRHPLRVGQEVPLRLRLPNDERIVIKVTIIWMKEVVVFNMREYQMGVKITDQVTENEIKFIKVYAKELRNIN